MKLVVTKNFLFFILPIYIYYTYRLSVISFGNILIMTDRQAPKALDLLSEEKCNLVILPKDITISLRQENTKYLNFVANLLEKNT